MSSKRILVIGDVIADVYRDCVFKKMCPDASGVRAIVETSRDTRPGGAANVAVNLAALSPDARIDLIGVVDIELARTIKYMSRSRVDLSSCVFSTPLRKERIMLGDEFVVRIDDANPDCSQSIQASLEEYLSSVEPDLIVLSDYGSGTVDWAVLPILLSRRDRLIVDTKMRDLSVFGADGRTFLVKLNDSEWRDAQTIHHSPEGFFSYVIVTHGGAGASLMMRSDTDRSGRSICQTVSVTGHRAEVVDVCGCGDTFLAGVAAVMAAGGDPHSAMRFANAAASTAVNQARTAVADLAQTIGLLGQTR